MSRKKSDAEQLQALLLWARKEKIVLRDVTIGAVSVTVERDHKLEVGGKDAPAPPRRPSFVEEFAGPLLQQMQGQSAAPETNEPTVEDEDP